MKKFLLLIISVFYVFCLTAQTFTYDDLNRLTKADYGNGYSISYQYDKLGNRTKKIITAGCQSITSQSAYYQSFEYGLGDWTQLETDSENWTAESGATLSSSTGPSTAQDGNSYLYTESSSPRFNKTMTLQSGCYDLSTGSSYNYTMDYHMFGSSTGRLRVQMSVNNGGYITIFDQSGDKGNSWKQLTYNLTNQAGRIVRFRIIATTGSSYRSDIAIDNIRIGADCPNNLTVSNTLANSLTTLPGEEHLAQNKVTSTVTLNNGSFHFGAGQCIELNAGFEVKNGVQFIADNNGCAISTSVKPEDSEGSAVENR